MSRSSGVLVQALLGGGLARGRPRWGRRCSAPASTPAGVPAQGPQGEGPVPAAPRAGVHTSRTVIWFWVRVPVLSEQITAAQPRVSTAGSFLTMALRPGHPPHPQGQHDGDDGGQPLGDGGHRQGHGGEEHVQHVPCPGAGPPRTSRRTRTGTGRTGTLEISSIFRWRGVSPCLLSRSRPAMLPHLRVHAGGGDHHGGPAAGDHRAGDHHVRPLGQGGVRRAGRSPAPLCTGTDSPVMADSSVCSPAASQDPPVGGDIVPRLQQEDVPGDQAECVSSRRSTPSRRTRARGAASFSQGLQGLLGVVLLGHGDAPR